MLPIPSPTSRTTLVAVGLLVAAALLSLVWLSHPYYEVKPDSSLYILTARSMLAGDGYVYMGIPVIMRPPGFSALLVPVLAVYGTSFLALNVYVGLFGVLCVSLLALYLRPRFGLALALAVAVAVWLNPDFQQLCREVFSDIPAAALMFGCFLVERWARSNDSLRRHAILALLIALATYVRTVTILLLPAILISRVLMSSTVPWGSRLRSAAGRGALMLAVALAVLLPWSARNGAQKPEAPVEEFFLYSYSVGMFHQDPGDPASPDVSWAEVLGRASSKGPRLAGSLGRWMQTGLPRKADTAVGLLVLTCVGIVLFRRRRPEEFFVLGALTLLSVYFTFAHRLQLPLYLIAFPAVVEVVLELLRKLIREDRARIAAVVLVLLPAAIEFRLPDRHEIAESHRLRLEVSSFLEQHFPPQATVAATAGRHWTVYTDRPVITLKHAQRRDGVRRVLEIIDEREVSGVIIDRDYRLAPRLLPALVERYEVLRDFGRFVVFDTAADQSP